ncbi:hypothetical protein [Fimbriiglobus ruber]|uniref:Phage tail length tape-measure protein n=1 Tax=Fimbriiglobus ruber TaxID=1908690 RepID=A0A225E754_9BACT|nr:hypothetical protein [Fimbriiglobus ruber]OWK46628.1 Phage tail length tape-measure protein [Fimbriiglobus ruber]
MAGVSGTIANGFIKIALSGLDTAKKQLAQVQETAAKVGGALQSVGAASAKGFAVGTASITGFLKAADPVRFSIFQAKLEILTMYIGRMFIPILEDAIKVVDRITDFFKSLSKEQEESVLKWTKIALSVLAVGTAIGALVAVGQKLLGFVKALQIALTILETSTGVGIVLVLAGIAVAVLELTGGMDALKETVGNLIKSFGGFGDGLSPISGALQKLGETFSKIFARIGAVAAPILNKVVAQISKLVSSAVPLIERIGKVFEDVVSEIGPIVESAVATVGPVIDELGTIFTKLVGDLTPIITDIGKQWGKLAADMLPVVVSLGKQFLEAGQQIATAFVQILPGLAQLAAMFLKIFAVYQQTLAVVFVNLAALFIKVWATYQTTLMKLFAVLMRAVEQVLPSLMQIISVVADVFANELMPVIQEVIGVVGELMETFGEIAGELMKFGAEVLGSLIVSLGKLFVSLIKTFGPTMITIIKGTLEVIKLIVDQIKTTVKLVKFLSDTLKKLNPLGGKSSEEPEKDETGGGGDFDETGGGGDFGEEPEKGSWLTRHIHHHKEKGEKDEKEKKDKPNHNMTPLPQLRKPEIFALEAGFTRAQQGAVIDPKREVENQRFEMMQKIAEDQYKVQQKIAQNTEKDGGAWET